MFHCVWFEICDIIMQAGELSSGEVAAIVIVVLFTIVALVIITGTYSCS